MARDITFDRVQNELDSLLKNLKRYLNNGNYTDSAKMVSDVLKLYRSTFGVDLDIDPEFDHIFHETIQKMDEIIIGTNPSPGDTSSHINLVNTLTKVSDGIFKVADVRKRVLELDPNLEDFVKANETGIEDAKKHIEKLEELKKDYAGIYKELFGKNTPDLKQKIDVENFNFGKLKTVSDSFVELKSLEQAIAQMEARIIADPLLETALRGNIDANKTKVSEIVHNIDLIIGEIETTGLNVSTIKNVSNVSLINRDDAKLVVDTLRGTVNADLVVDYAKILKNLKDVVKNHPEIIALQDIDFTGMDSNTQAGREKIDNAIMPFLNNFKSIDDSIRYQNNLIDVYTKSIEQMKEEQKILDIDTTDRQRYIDGMDTATLARIQAEEEYYKQDEYDKMYGNSEKARKYREYFKALKASEKDVSFDFVNADGNLQIGTYRTLDYTALATALDSVSVKEALKLMQLEEYRDKLERTSRFKAGDMSALKEFPSYRDLERAETDDEKDIAVSQIRREIDEDLEYLKTYHLASNTHEFREKAIGDAGTLVKFKNGIMPVKGNGILKAGAYNYASWIGLQNPAKAKTALGKIGYTVLDVGLIAMSPISVITKAIYRYTPVVGKEAQKKRYYEKYNGEHSSPYDGRADARKMNRQEYYMEDMRGPLKRFRSWIKATNDDLFKKDRRNIAEEDILEQHFEENIRPSIRSRYVEGARRKDLETQVMAQGNVEIRKSAVREIAGRDYVYNDMIREPNKATVDIVRDRIIQGSALELNGENSEKLDYTESFRPRDRRFKKDIRGAIGCLASDLKSELDYSNPEGVVVQTDAVGRNVREKAIVASTTKRNYIPYILTGVAVGATTKAVLSRVLNFTKTEVIPGEAERVEVTEVPEVIPAREVPGKKFLRWEEIKASKEVPIFEDRPDINSIPSTTNELRDAFNNVTGRVNTSVFGGKRGNLVTDLTNYDHTTGFHVRIPDAQGNIREFGIRLPETGYNYENLNPLAREWGLDSLTVAKYIDATTGNLKGDADVFDLIADVINNQSNGGLQNITGDSLKTLVLTDDRCSAYAHLIQTAGYRDGGWIDVTTGQTIRNIPVQVDTEIVEEVIRRNPIYEDIIRTIPERTIMKKVPITIPGTPDTVNVVENVAANRIRDGILTGSIIGNALEATEKALREKESKEKGPEKFKERDRD